MALCMQSASPGSHLARAQSCHLFMGLHEFRSPPSPHRQCSMVPCHFGIFFHLHQRKAAFAPNTKHVWNPQEWTGRAKACNRAGYYRWCLILVLLQEASGTPCVWSDQNYQELELRMDIAHLECLRWKSTHVTHAGLHLCSSLLMQSTWQHTSPQGDPVQIRYFQLSSASASCWLKDTSCPVLVYFLRIWSTWHFGQYRALVESVWLRGKNSHPSVCALK